MLTHTHHEAVHAHAEKPLSDVVLGLLNAGLPYALALGLLALHELFS